MVILIFEVREGREEVMREGAFFNKASNLSMPYLCIKTMVNQFTNSLSKAGNELK